MDCLLTVSTPSASVLSCFPLSCLRSGGSFSYLLSPLVSVDGWLGPPTFRHQYSPTLPFCQLSVEQVVVDYPSSIRWTCPSQAGSAMSEEGDQALESSSTEDPRQFDGQNT